MGYKISDTIISKNAYGYNTSWYQHYHVVTSQYYKMNKVLENK